MFLLSYAAVICVRKRPYLPRRDKNNFFPFCAFILRILAILFWTKSNVKMFTFYCETEINVCFGRSFYRTNNLYFHTPFNGHIHWKIVKGPSEIRIQYDKVSANGATSIPQCASKSGGSLDELRGSPNISNYQITQITNSFRETCSWFGRILTNGEYCLSGKIGFIKKHCQRHNGPKGWVLLTKVTSLGHIASSHTNLEQISS